MQHLRNLVKEINQTIAGRLNETARLNGLVRQVRRQKEGTTEYTNLDRAGNPVVFDDRWNITLYHRLVTIGGDQITGRGKGNRYKFEARMLLLCSAKQETTHDQVVMLLAGMRNVNYVSSDFNIDRIIRQETGGNSVNIERSLFQIEYTLSYLSDNCFDDCEVAELAQSGDTDCIEISQGGILSVS